MHTMPYIFSSSPNKYIVRITTYSKARLLLIVAHNLHTTIMHCTATHVILTRFYTSSCCPCHKFLNMRKSEFYAACLAYTNIHFSGHIGTDHVNIACTVYQIHFWEHINLETFLPILEFDQFYTDNPNQRTGMIGLLVTFDFGCLLQRKKEAAQTIKGSDHWTCL